MARQMAVRPRARTRDRVLSVSLALFNERGIAGVTTAEIAAGCGINEGNLYYYFQKKEQLALALFDRFMAALQAAAARPLGDPRDPASYAAYQRGWFDVMWEYRFCYRDGGTLRHVAPELRARVDAVTRQGQAAVANVFGLMRAHGLLDATDQEIAGLVANIWIVSSYWMDFRHGAGGPVTEADLAWGLRQVAMLYRPYLRGAGRMMITNQ